MMSMATPASTALPNDTHAARAAENSLLCNSSSGVVYKNGGRIAISKTNVIKKTSSIATLCRNIVCLYQLVAFVGGGGAFVTAGDST